MGHFLNDSTSPEKCSQRREQNVIMPSLSNSEAHKKLLKEGMECMHPQAQLKTFIRVQSYSSSFRRKMHLSCYTVSDFEELSKVIK